MLYQADFSHIARFNSQTSDEFLQKYETYVDDQIQKKNAEVRGKTFAPSSMRCQRQSWFKLKGTQPDVPSAPDRTLNFTAQIGTACHEIIQQNLAKIYGDDWIDVSDYIAQANLPYEIHCEKRGYETLIEIVSPPVKFACDGILRINGRYYLLEIKTSEYSSFDKLTNAKDQHVAQIKTYGSLLNINKALVLYQERQYGGMKCFEMDIDSLQMKEVIDGMYYVMDMVEANIAPSGLPSGDYWCSPNMCSYYKKCQEYGRYS